MATPILKIDNGYSQLVTNDENLKELLWKLLRFRDRNYFHSALYKAKKWDGFQNFFSEKTGKFLTGLLPEVKYVLKSKNIEYVLDDNRESFNFIFNKIDEQFMNYGENAIILRDYQVELVNQAIKLKRGIIKAPTGCHRAGQGILLYDGTIKNVEDIVVDDMLMGMDGTPRTVLNLCRGEDTLYEIKPNKGKSFYVNGEHILTLSRPYLNKKEYKIVDIPLKNYISKSKEYKLMYKLFRLNKNYEIKKYDNLRSEFDLDNNYITGFSIKKLSKIEPYFGFALDGDGRYLLDDFTVTHNSGKSNTMIALTRCLPPKTPTLILTNRKSLVDQNYEELKKWDIDGLGRVYDNICDINYITCSTVQSAHKLDDFLPKVKAIIVDEIHELMNKSSMDLYKRIPNAIVRVCMSATPFKFDGKDLVHKYRVKGWFGPQFEITSSPDKELTTKFLQERETLSKSKCIFYKIKEPQIQWDVYMDALDVISTDKKLNKKVAKLATSLNGRTLILVERLAHGDLLQSFIPKSFWLKGEDPLKERKPVIEKLTASNEDVIVIASSGIMSTGLNFRIHNLINCASGNAQHLITQRIGRGLRTASDKDMLNYYDFLYLVNPYLQKHSYNRIKTLEKLGHEIVIEDDFDF